MGVEAARLPVTVLSAALRSVLDAYLLTDAELAEGKAAWRRYPDPFPRWS